MLQARLLLLVSGVALHLCGVVSMEVELISTAPLWARLMVLFQYFGLGAYPVYIGLRGSNEDIHGLFSIVLADAAPEALKRSVQSSPRYPAQTSLFRERLMMLVDFLLYASFLYSVNLFLQGLWWQGGGILGGISTITFVRFWFFSSPFSTARHNLFNR